LISTFQRSNTQNKIMNILQHLLQTGHTKRKECCELLQVHITLQVYTCVHFVVFIN